MKTERAPDELFALARRYASVSLAAILATAIALAVLYRELSVRTIVGFGEQSNVTVAETALNAIRPELTGYLRDRESATTIANIDTFPPGPLRLIRASVRDTPIERIKVYSRNGIVLYSTLEHEIGTDDSANPGFQGSIRGTVRSRLLYHDAFNLFGATNADDNLIETYVPIRQPGDPQPIGVLEIYTDVDPIVRSMSHNVLLVLTGIAAIMVILYSFLLYVVRRAAKIINDQRRTILERNETLEVLSARMMDADEAERRRVSRELHEEVAQTLSAAKIKIEAIAIAAARTQPLSLTHDSEEIVPLVQGAIRDIRALAMDLRPPTLDDFGLIATIRALCTEVERDEGQSEITAEITAREEDVPDALKNVIFRILQQTLKRLVGMPRISDIRVALRKEELLRLVVDFRAESGETSDGEEQASSTEKRPMTDFWERAVLSGGSFSTSGTNAGRFRYQATWIV
jgi:signal transduction histidine kinase